MANWVRQRRQHHQTGHGQCADLFAKIRPKVPFFLGLVTFALASAAVSLLATVAACHDPLVLPLWSAAVSPPVCRLGRSCLVMIFANIPVLKKYKFKKKWQDYVQAAKKNTRGSVYLPRHSVLKAGLVVLRGFMPVAVKMTKPA